MSKPRDLAKEQLWRQTLADWQSSGLSVAAFCRQRQLDPQAFFRWRQLLRRRDQPATAASCGPHDPAAAPPLTDAASPPLFVPVAVRPSTPAGSAAFEIVLRCGRLLRCSAGFDADALRQLIVVLQQLPC